MISYDESCELRRPCANPGILRRGCTHHRGCPAAELHAGISRMKSCSQRRGCCPDSAKDHSRTARVTSAAPPPAPHRCTPLRQYGCLAMSHFVRVPLVVVSRRRSGRACTGSSSSAPTHAGGGRTTSDLIKIRTWCEHSALHPNHVLACACAAGRTRRLSGVRSSTARSSCHAVMGSCAPPLTRSLDTYIAPRHENWAHQLHAN